MAIQTIRPRPMFMHHLCVASLNTFVLNGADLRAANIFYWPGGDLTKMAFICSAVSGSPEVSVRLFATTLTDGTGVPIDYSTPIGSEIAVSSISANVAAIADGIGQTALAAGYYAISMRLTSGTSATLVRAYNSELGSQGTKLPIAITSTDAGSTQTRVSGAFHMSLGNSAGWLPTTHLFPACLFTTTAAYQSGSNPDEYIGWFKNTDPVDYRLCGLQFANQSSTLSDLLISIYSGTKAGGSVTPTLVTSLTLDRDVGLQGGAGNHLIPWTVANKPTIAAGAEFGIGVQALSAINTSIQVADFGTGNSALLESLWGLDQQYGTRNDASGNITLTDTRTLLIQPWVDGIDAGSSGGGRRVVMNTDLMFARVAANNPIIPVDLFDGDGVAVTGIAYDTAGLTISVKRELDAGATLYEADSSDIEDITTLGTYVAPSTDKIRFKLIGSNDLGAAEIHLPQAAVGTGDLSRWATVKVALSGVVIGSAKIKLVYDVIGSAPLATQSSLDGVGSDASAAKLAAESADTKIGTPVTSVSADIATIDTEVGVIDGLVDAIKAKTDSLTFTVAGKADANITHINEVEVTGDGTSGTEWGPA